MQINSFMTIHHVKFESLHARPLLQNCNNTMIILEKYISFFHL